MYELVRSALSESSQGENTPRIDRPYTMSALRGAALGVPIYLVAIHFWAWLCLLIAPGFYIGAADFRQFYTGAFMVRAGYGHELYDLAAQEKFENRLVSQQSEEHELPFVSPAYHALLLSPFTLVAYKPAFFAFAILNLCLLCISLRLLLRWTENLRSIYRWLPFAMLVGFTPIALAFIEGQDSVMLTAILICCFVLLLSERQFAAGLLLGLGLFKLQIVLPIAALFIIWKRWRLIAGFGVAAGLVICTSIWITGFEPFRLYVLSLVSVARLSNRVLPIATHQPSWAAMGNIHGLVFATLNHLTPHLVEPITLLLSAGIIVWVAMQGTNIRESWRLLLTAIPAAVLVSHHAYLYDFSVLVLPVIWLLNDSVLSDRKFAGMAATMFAAPMINSYFYSAICYVLPPVCMFFLWALMRKSHISAAIQEDASINVPVLA